VSSQPEPYKSSSSSPPESAGSPALRLLFGVQKQGFVSVFLHALTRHVPEEDILDAASALGWTVKRIAGARLILIPQHPRQYRERRPDLLPREHES
jgi:hypothetical protein